MPVINQISSANTFSDWLISTQALIEHANYFSSNVALVISTNTDVQLANTNAWTARNQAVTANANSWVAATNSQNTSNTANTAASNAQTSSNNANTAASNAQTSSNNANTARSGAETANTNAWTARNQAVTANTNAQTANTNAYIALNTILSLNTLNYIETIPATNKGISGHTKGMVFLANNFFYYCTADYNGTTNIWSRIASTDSW